MAQCQPRYGDPKLVNTGKLPAHRISSKVIRVSEADVIAFLEDAKRNDCNTP